MCIDASLSYDKLASSHTAKTRTAHHCGIPLLDWIKWPGVPVSKPHILWLGQGMVQHCFHKPCALTGTSRVCWWDNKPPS